MAVEALPGNRSLADRRCQGRADAGVHASQTG